MEYQSIVDSIISQQALLFRIEKNKTRKEVVRIMNSSSESETGPIQCAICLEEIREKTKLLPCSHRFCQYCLFQWINVKLYCPVCRQRVEKLLFKNGLSYDEVCIEPRPTMVTTFKDFIYQNPTMLKVAIKCLYEYFMNHAELSHVGSIPIITFEDFKRGTHSSCTNRTLSILFRSLTYQYNLSPYRDHTRNIRDTSLQFLREHPGFISRIVEFAKFDLEILQKLSNFQIDSVIYDAIKKLLTHYDLQTSAFRLNLRLIIRKYCTKGNARIDFSFKFYTELNNFARNDLFTPLEYVQSTSYIFTAKQKPLAEVITLSESSDSDIQIIAENANEFKRSRVDEDPTPGPSGIYSNKKHKNKKSRLNCSKVKVYTKRDVREMRRIIRNSQNSEYFFRKLMLEIKKKFYNYDTILNTKHFSHLTDFFKNILLSSKLYRSRKLNNVASKRTLTIDEINRRLNKNSTSSFSRSHSSSETVSDSEIALEQYESVNQSHLNNQVVKHALSPSHSITTHLLMMSRVKTIHFKNHVYSDSD